MFLYFTYNNITYQVRELQAATTYPNIYLQNVYRRRFNFKHLLHTYRLQIPTPNLNALILVHVTIKVTKFSKL